TDLNLKWLLPYFYLFYLKSFIVSKLLGDSSFTVRSKTPTSNRFKILKNIRNDCVSL
ncbi:unnamed protein product, partial [Tenebrio molitor]